MKQNTEISKFNLSLRILYYIKCCNHNVSLNQSSNKITTKTTYYYQNGRALVIATIHLVL